MHMLRGMRVRRFYIFFAAIRPTSDYLYVFSDRHTGNRGSPRRALIIPIYVAVHGSLEIGAAQGGALTYPYLGK